MNKQDGPIYIILPSFIFCVSVKILDYVLQIDL